MNTTDRKKFRGDGRPRTPKSGHPWRRPLMFTHVKNDDEARLERRRKLEAIQNAAGCALFALLVWLLLIAL